MEPKSEVVLKDLNGLISPGSDWVLTNAFSINGMGQIVGKASTKAS